MRTILVPAGGSESDRTIFDTALLAARSLSAHLDFYHVRVTAGEAALNAPYAGFAMGAGLSNTLDQLQAEANTRLIAAHDIVEKFCGRHRIPMLDKPHGRNEVSASWCEEAGESMPLIIRRARHSDLVVIGRKQHRDHLPDDLLERLLLKIGRPILVSAPHATPAPIKTVMVCWKECAQAAHAVTAAMPLLRCAARVVVVSVAENGDDEAVTAVDGLARQMLWHGIHAHAQCIAPDGRSVANVLMAAAEDCKADLVVMGGYSHSRIREIIFGGCTDVFLRTADRAVLLVH